VAAGEVAMGLIKKSRAAVVAEGVAILRDEHLTPARIELEQRTAKKRAELAAKAAQRDLLDEAGAGGVEPGAAIDDDEAALARLQALDAELNDGLAELEGKTKPRDAARGLVAYRHPQRDFFLADLFDYAIKDDGASMEAPIFSLSTKPDTRVWKWTSQDGARSVEVVPSALGRATQHDKDILIFVISQLTEALNRGREDAKARTVRFTIHDLLVTTNRGTRGDDYERLKEALKRLKGTNITTDIKTGGERITEGFGIIEKYKVIHKAKDNERMAAVEVTISEWLHNAIQAHEVLTIHPDYFRLRKPLARRIYELARKHCGKQSHWQCKLSTLLSKSGSRGTAYELLDALRQISKEDTLPQYRVTVAQKSGRVEDTLVTFTQRGAQAAVRAALTELALDPHNL